MFRRLAEITDPVSLEFEGQTITAQSGDSVAAALLLANAGPFRTTAVSGSDRSVYCMMGACFDCYLEIDGVPNVQGCMTPVRDGMQIRRQTPIPEVKA